MSDAAQGLIAPFILIGEAELHADKPLSTGDAIGSFHYWARNVAWLVPGEFPEEALLYQDMTVWYGNVMNGGHAQYAKNTRMDDAMLDRTGRCLAAIGAEPIRAVFADFRTFMQANPEAAQRLVSSNSFDDIPKELEHLDRRFYAADKDGTFWPAVQRWIQTMPVVKALPPEALAAAKAAILAANPLRQVRIDAAAAAKAEAESKDPLLVAVKALCRAAGIEFKMLGARRKAPGHGYFTLSLWPVPEQGWRVLVGGGQAVLTDKGNQPIGNPVPCDAPSPFEG